MASPLTELSKVFQAGYFDIAQMKSSVELCINKLYDAAAKSEFKANCEKFDSEWGKLGTLDDLAASCLSSGMAFWKSAESFSKFTVPIHKRETGVDEPITAASLYLVSQEKCMPRYHENKLNQSWMIPSVVFDAAVALKKKFLHSSKFKNSWDDAKDLYTCFVDLGKRMAGFFVKYFGGCYGSAVLTGASCWPSSSCIPDQKIVSASEG